MLYFKRKTSNPGDVLLLSNTCMYMHAIYKIREFLSYKGFNLIKLYFRVHYNACVCYQLLFRETVPVAPAVKEGRKVKNNWKF